MAVSCRNTRRSLVNRWHWRITCSAVSHCHPQGHAGESKPGTRQRWRKVARPILPVRICVRMLVCAFGKPACSRSAAAWASCQASTSPLLGRGQSSGLGGGGGGGGVVPLLAVASGPSTIALLVVDKPECLWRRRVAACRVLCGAMAGSSPALMVWVNCSNWACLQMVL